MKIVCDSCATKYSISDDKVRGKVFKIRCKKCSHIIVVRGTTDAASATPAAAASADGGGWHLVVDGEQVGPLPESEIRARLSRNEINGETYIWKEGLADWLKLSTVAEFADAVSAPPLAEPGAAAAGGSSDLFTDNVPIGAAAGPMTVQVDDGLIQASIPARSGGGLFGAIDAANGSGGRAAVRAGASEEGDVFSAPAASRGGGGDLFASHAAAQPALSDDGRRGGGAAAGHDGGRVENLTAQRHENSVLFSLANLQQLAMPSVAAKPSSSAPSSNGSTQSEGSGLIDIRAMAATTLGAPSDARGGGGGSLGDDLPTFGSFSSAAPVLLSLPTSSGPPKWLYAVIVGMALLVISIGVMAYKLFTTKPVTVVEQVTVPAPAPVALAPTGATAPKVAAATPGPGTTPAPTIPDDKLPPREGETDATKVAAETGAKHDKPAGLAGGSRKLKAGGAKNKGAAGADTGGGKAAAAVAAAPPEPEVKKPAKGSLDDLLEGALSGKKPRSRPSASNNDDDSGPRKSPSTAEPASSAPLSKSAVVSGMNGIKGKITECYSQFKVPGMAMVNVVIGKNGKVSSATVIGKFAGTPTGGCVEKAVKSASFPPSEGLTTPYPFQLR